ncbi:hypothetical protein D9756_005003 [Leucocoprinus leucothites]|uniref:Uncharacterized protein n=1 Tax=Leucocoprinus leucothites TaxID=201217 RepID=A0A8H5LKI3_9AGAR|nr:hypothetical protein D9756_005003 [Leucoagaricus leucothites]
MLKNFWEIYCDRRRCWGWSAERAWHQRTDSALYMFLFLMRPWATRLALASFAPQSLHGLATTVAQLDPMHFGVVVGSVPRVTANPSLLRYSYVINASHHIPQSKTPPLSITAFNSEVFDLRARCNANKKGQRLIRSGSVLQLGKYGSPRTSVCDPREQLDM